MDFFDTIPSKSLPSDSKKATTSKTKTDDTKQASSVSVDFFTASSGSGATVTPEKSGGFLRLPKPSKKKTPPRVREDTASAAASRTERISAVSVSTLSRPSQSSRAIPKFGQGTPVSQEKSTLSQDFFSVATNVSAASDEVTLSHPAATMPKASGFTLRLPKASKKKTPPRERERGPNQSIGFFGAARSEQASVQSSTASDVLDPDSSIQFALGPLSELEQQVPQEFHTATSTESKTEEVNKEAAQVPETTFLSAESIQPQFAAEASSELEQQVPQQEFHTATSTESKTEEVNKEAAQVPETTFLSAESIQPQFAAEASSELEQQVPQQEFHTATSTESKTEEVNKEAAQVPETTFLSAESIQPQFAAEASSELEQQVPQQEFHTATSTESKTEEVNKEAAQVPETTFLSAESIQPQFAAEASSELEQQVPQQEFHTATSTESKTEEVNKEASHIPETTFLSAESMQPQFAAEASSELEQQVPQQEFHTATSTESKTEEVNTETAQVPETTFLSAESIQPQFAAEASSELEQQVPQQEFHTATSTESKTEEVKKEAAHIPETTFLSAESIQPQFAAEASSELEQQVPQQEFHTASSTESKTEEVNKEAAQVSETTFLSAESIQPQFAAEASSELEQQVPQQEFHTATSTESKTEEVNKEAAHIPETTFLSAESIQPQFAAEASSELEQQVPQQEFHTATSTESKTEEVNKEAAQVSETTFLSAESMQPQFAAEASSELEQPVPQQEFHTASSTESKTEEVNKEAAQVSETTFLSAESIQPQFAAEASSELEQQVPQQEFHTATSTESKTEEVNKEAAQVSEITFLSAESMQPQFAAEASSELEQQVPQQEFHTATSTESKTEEVNKEATQIPETTAESIQPQFAAEASSEAEQQVPQQQEFHTATSTERKTEEANKEAAHIPETTFLSAESIPQFGSIGSPSSDIFSPSTRATRSKGLHKPRDFGAAAADQHLEVARPSSLKEEAAAKIQAQYRGRLARLRFTKLKAGLAMARLRVRVHKYHEDASATGQPDSKAGTGQTAAFLELLEPHVVGTEDSRSKAALKIQAVFRGKMARRHVAHQQGEASAIQAATRIQAMFRGRQGRKAKSKTNQLSLGIHQVGQPRIKALKQHDAAAASPRSPMVQQEQKAFLETPAHSPRTQAEDRAAIRLQAVIRGLRVRRQIGLKKKAASKIQARFRGWQGRKLAHDLASVVNLRVRVRNFHASAAFASTAGKFPSKQIDPTFFDAKTGRVVAQLTEETAAMKIQKFYRTKTTPSDQPIAQQSLNLGTSATMQAVGSAVRRSLVAAGFAVVGEANANISQLFTRASITFDEALQAGDRAAQRASVAMGESLLQMVVDTTSPPISPNAAGATEDEEDSDDSDVSSEEATGPQEQKPAAKERRKLKPKQAVASFIRSMDQSCVAWAGINYCGINFGFWMVEQARG